MEIKGYKVFSKGRINRYGKVYEEGKHYHVDGKIVFGNYGNGIHFCKKMEDTFRYVDAVNNQVEVAEVIGSGEMVEFNDEYYGYYDMYAVRKLYIRRFISREEMIKMMLEVDENRAFRFIQFFPLSDDEKEMFKLAYASKEKVLDGNSYYKEGDTEVYARKKETS